MKRLTYVKKLLHSLIALGIIGWTTRTEAQFTFDQQKLEKAKNIFLNINISEDERVKKIVTLFNNEFTKYEVDVDGIKSIHLAIVLGLNDITKDLLSKNKRLATMKSSSKHKPAHYAAYMGNIEVLKLLAKNNINLKKEAGDLGKKAIHYAAAGGNPEVITFLINTHGATIYDETDNGNGPLQIAVSSGQIKTAEWLIAQGANIKSSDKMGRTSIHIAAMYGKIAMLKWLVSKGARINDQNYNGHTPFHYAAGHGRLATMRWLISQHIDIESKNKHGTTALTLTIGAGHFNATKLLIEHGAIIDNTLLSEALAEIKNKKKKKSLQDYLTDMQKFFCSKKQEFSSYVKKRISDAETPGNGRATLLELIQRASYRDLSWIDKLYNTILSLFDDENERKAFGFCYQNKKEFYLAALTQAPSSFKRKQLLLELLKKYNTGNIDTAEAGSFEWELAHMLRNSKLFDKADRFEIEEYYEKNHALKQNMHKLVIPKYIRTPQVTVEKGPGVENFVDITMKTAQ